MWWYPETPCSGGVGSLAQTLNSSKIALGLAGFLGIVAMACSSPARTIAVGTIQQPNTDSGGEVHQVNRIAYVNPNGDLVTVDPDGGGLAQLTGPLQAEGGPEGVIQPQS